jgi:hypothetical protein
MFNARIREDNKKILIEKLIKEGKLDKMNLDGIF